MKKNFTLVLLVGLFAGSFFSASAQKDRFGKFQLDDMGTQDPDGGSQSKLQSIMQAMQWRTSMLADSAGNVYPSYYLNAVKKADQMKSNASATRSAPLAWQELGPGNIGGRTRSILFDNRDPSRQTIYAGAVGGGLWKSVDDGNSWNQLDSVNQCLAVSCIAQDINGNIYFGTGEGLAQPSGTSRNSGQVGNGLHLLHGNDLDSVLPSTIPTGIDNAIPWCMINRIAINPTNPQDIYVATSAYLSAPSGLEHSTDGGQTWVIIGSSAMPISGLTTAYNGAADVKFSSDGSLIFASVGMGAGFPGETFIESQDGGNSWIAPATSNFPQYPSGVWRIEIGVAPSDPNTVYFVVVQGGGSLGGIYKSADGGNTFTEIGQPGGALSSPFGSDNQGWYDCIISVNPKDPGKVYFGGTQLFNYSSGTGGWTEASIYFGDPSNPQWVHADMHAIVFNDKDSNEMWIGCDGGLFQSEDAYSGFPTPHYTTKNRNYAVTQNYSVAADLYGSVLGGAQDNGTNYVDYTNGAPTYALNVYGGDGPYAEISHFDPNIFIGGYVGGQDFRSSTKGNAWLPMFDNVINPGTGADPASNNEPSICGLAMGENANFVSAFWLVESSNAYNSIDSVAFADTITHYAGEVITLTSRIKQTFTETLTDSIPKGDTVNFVDRLKARLYFATVCGLWVTPDILDFTNTPRWFRVTSTSGDVKSLTASPTGDTIYFADANTVQRMTGMNSVLAFDTALKGHNDILMSSGALWHDTITSVTGGAGGSRSIEGIDADLNDPNHVLCAVAGYTTNGYPHVYQSSNAGLTWTPIPTGVLPDMPVYQCVIDYYNPQHYIIGTELGVWDSYDMGNTWTEENNNGLFRVPVFRLRQQNYLSPNCYSIYIGTHGQGMWRSTTLTSAAGCQVNPLAVPQISPTTINNLLVYPNPLNTSAGTVKIELSEASDVTLRVIDMPGRVVQESHYSKLPQGKNEISLNTSNIANGTYLVVATLANGQMMTRTAVVAK